MTANMRVDAYATQPHYYDHIKPVWDALEADGTFYVSASTQRKGTPTRGLPHSDVPLIVAGYPDIQRTRRPIIFIEHGAGENYQMTDPHYSGGVGRDRVILFLCPNEKVAKANSIYPVPSVVVGSPRLESLAQQNLGGHQPARGSRDGRLRVAVSFHWNCQVHPQTSTALFYYQSHFRHWATDPRIELIGHAHPRIAARAERSYAPAAIPFVPRFDDVVSWAEVYAVDNSSTLFEAAALGLDVVVLDAPQYSAEETGWRFWRHADIGPRIQSGENFVEAALQANHNAVSYAAARHRMVAEVFGPLEGSTQRAVEAIRSVIDDNRRTESSPSPADPGADTTQPSLFGIG